MNQPQDKKRVGVAITLYNCIWEVLVVIILLIITTLPAALIEGIRDFIQSVQDNSEWCLDVIRTWPALRFVRLILCRLR
jgi:hypothetical protein